MQIKTVKLQTKQVKLSPWTGFNDKNRDRHAWSWDYGSNISATFHRMKLVAAKLIPKKLNYWTTKMSYFKSMYKIHTIISAKRI